MPVIQCLQGFEILDSRGRPTVKARCELNSGAIGVASVPSGASTGTAEALELRDGGARYRGLGCRRAIENIDTKMDAAFRGRAFTHQNELDTALVELDGTPNKSRLGANATLAVSLAFARATAAEQTLPLYGYFAKLTGRDCASMPRPTINLFSGGKHAGSQVAIQDVLIVPMSAASIDAALAMAFEVYQCAAELILRRYGMRLLRADEGGLAPPAPNCEALLADAVEAIEMAKLKAGKDVCLAVDVASSQFFHDGQYGLDGKKLSAPEMIGRLNEWVTKYPIVSVEDGLAEEDWGHWPALRTALNGRAIVLGDDFLCTNPARIRRAVDVGAANALLLKVNQIGTLSEAAEACRLAKAAGWHVTASARSGETEDDWLADLAVGWSADHIKIGSITQSERLSKYNRLLEIEAQTGWPMR